MDEAQLRMRNSLKLGLYINVAGMLLALIGAEQIVGTLVAKVLYSQGEGLRLKQKCRAHNEYFSGGIAKKLHSTHIVGREQHCTA